MFMLRPVVRMLGMSHDGGEDDNDFYLIARVSLMKIILTLSASIIIIGTASLSLDRIRTIKQGFYIFQFWPRDSVS